MMPIVVFDFDKTLTEKDTVLGFLLEATDKRFKHIRKPVFLLFAVLHKLGLIGNDRLKKAGIWLFLKNMPETEIRKRAAVYAKGIRLNTIYDTEFVLKYPNAIVATASYEDYVKPLCSDHILLAAKLEYKDGKVSGLKQNAYGSQKVALLKAQGIQKIDIFYTDSYNDQPMMNISSVVFLVKNNLIKKIKG